MTTPFDFRNAEQIDYDFEVLDELILEELNPEHSGFNITPENLTDCFNISRAQKDKLKKRIVSTAFNLLDEKTARVYVQKHQMHISSLVHSLTGYSLSKATLNDPGYLKTIDSIRDNLEALLKFLQVRYQDYFDFNDNATVALRQIVSAKLLEKLDYIYANVKQQKCGLLAIALKPIWDFLSDDPREIISYRRLLYFEAILKEIGSIVNKEQPLEEALKFSLICLNYNSFRFFGFLTDELTNELEGISIQNWKTELLSSYLKKYNQIYEYPEFVFNPRQISIKQQITGWIIEEIEHLERSSKRSVTPVTCLKGEQKPDFKLETELSVAQIGYFLKLFFDTGLLKNKNHQETIRFLSSVIKSKNTESISPDSLRTRFYNIDEGTRRSVKEMVISMLSQINKQN